MPKAELTKQLLAGTLKQLAKTKNVDKVSVSELVEAAGLNRQTFYYHFQDKQELICWIFDTDASKLKDDNQDGTLLDELVEYLHSEKHFYMYALTSDEQNSLLEHIFEIFRRHLAEDLLRFAGSRIVEDSILHQLSRFFANGLTGCLVQWAQEGMRYEDAPSMQGIAPLINELLAFAVSRCSK